MKIFPSVVCALLAVFSGCSAMVDEEELSLPDQSGPRTLRWKKIESANHADPEPQSGTARVEVCPDRYSAAADLIAGNPKNHPNVIGRVWVDEDPDGYLTLKVRSSWIITEYHIYYDIGKVPKTKAPGQFNYKKEGMYLQMLDKALYPKPSGDDCAYISFHAVVKDVGHVVYHNYFRSSAEICNVGLKFAHSGCYWRAEFPAMPNLFSGLNVCAWCVDTGRVIGRGPHCVDTISSYDADAEHYVDKPGNLPNANWLINNYSSDQHIGACGGQDITYKEIQRAIWQLLEDDPSSAGIGGYNGCVADELYHEALNKGNYFRPDCYDKVLVLIIVDDNHTGDIGNPTKQVIAGEVDAHCVPGTGGSETAWAFLGTDIIPAKGKSNSWGGSYCKHNDVCT